MESEKKRYNVEYYTEYEADTPEEAAKQFQAAIARGGLVLSVLEMREPWGDKDRFTEVKLDPYQRMTASERFMIMVSLRILQNKMTKTERVYIDLEDIDVPSIERLISKLNVPGS